MFNLPIDQKYIIATMIYRDISNINLIKTWSIN